MEKPLDINESAQQDPAQKKGLIRRGMRTVRRVSVLVAGGFWLAGTLLWLTVRDRFPQLAPLSYGLPLPLLIFFGAWATAFLRTERRKVRIAWFVVVVIQIVADVSTETRC